MTAADWELVANRLEQLFPKPSAKSAMENAARNLMPAGLWQRSLPHVRPLSKQH